MKVVVVGSGIGGISAAYHLAHDGHHVTLVEQNDRLGGHTYPMEIDGDQVDLGFMMFGDSNPNIKNWFRQFGITEPDGTTKTLIPMSLTVNSDIPQDLQFSSRKPFSGYADLLDRRKWKVLVDIYKFTWDLLTCQSTINMPGMTDAKGAKNPSITTKEWAQQAGYSPEFFRHYFLAFCAILWTIPKQQVMDLPVNQFLRCLRTHANSLYIPLWEVIMRALGRGSVRPKHLWYYIGSKYLEPFRQDFEQHNGQVRYNAQVQLVAKGGKEVVLKSGEKIKCDHVVLACHADEAAALLPWSEQAQKQLTKYVFHKSMMYVHRDPSFLPDDQKTWSSWNVKITKDDEYVLTYCLLDEPHPTTQVQEPRVCDHHTMGLPGPKAGQGHHHLGLPLGPSAIAGRLSSPGKNPQRTRHHVVGRMARTWLPRRWFCGRTKSRSHHPRCQTHQDLFIRRSWEHSGAPSASIHGATVVHDRRGIRGGCHGVWRLQVGRSSDKKVSLQEQ